MSIVWVPIYESGKMKLKIEKMEVVVHEAISRGGTGSEVGWEWRIPDNALRVLKVSLEGSFLFKKKIRADFLDG